MSMIKRRGTGAAPLAAGSVGPAGSPLLHKVFSTKNILEQLGDSHTAEVGSIKKDVDATIKDLVKETKFAWMERGEFFYLNRKLNHFRLPQMRRHIEFCEAKSASELLTEVKTRIPLEAIQGVILPGSDAASASPGQKKKVTPAKASPTPSKPSTGDTFIFSIVYKTEGGQEQTLDLQTSNRRSFVDWFDGLKLLTGGEPELPETQEEMEALKSIELECRLIEEESKGAQTLSLDAPTIPPAPTDYNFYYK